MSNDIKERLREWHEAFRVQQGYHALRADLIAAADRIEELEQALDASTAVIEGMTALVRSHTVRPHEVVPFPLDWPEDGAS